MNNSKLWTEVLKEARNYFNEQIVETWLKPLRVKDLSGDRITIVAPNKFYKMWIEQNYIVKIKDILRENFSINADILITSDNTTIERHYNEEVNKIQLTPNKTNLNRQYTFENFVVGTSNQFAYTACFSISEGNFHTYNPLYIYGGVGLGKTHLLHAVGNKLQERFSKLKILYIPSESFTNEMITAIRQNKMDDFREKYRTIDVLLFDDAQFLSGKDRTTEEFFYTFNTLYDAQKQIMISSDKSPAQMLDMEERITSRFSWGLIADVQPPSTEEKTAILIKIAEIKKIEIDENIALYLAENIKSDNNRELIGALIRLSAFSKFKNVTITTELINECLDSYLIKKDRVITVDDVLKTVGIYFNIKPHELKSRKRTKSISLPRNIAIYLLKEKLNISLQEIGDILGGRDHSTVLYSINAIKGRVKNDPEIKEVLNILNKELYK
jgi:chromosomal replication initiator protein